MERREKFTPPQPADFAGLIVSGDGYVGHQDCSDGLKLFRAPSGKPAGAK